MKNKDIVKIDFNKWTTQTKKAKSFKSKNGTGCSVEYISKLVASGKLKSLRIDQLNITLVEK